MEKKYIVTLTDEDRLELNRILSNGNAPAKKHRIAWVLLRADESSTRKYFTDEVIAVEAGVSASTVRRLREKFMAGGLEKVFEKKSTPRLSRRKFKGEEEAKLITLCCSEAPEGYARWSLRLLADKVVELQILDEVSYSTIHQTLKKTNLSLG
jgi:hypothetical protein